MAFGFGAAFAFFAGLLTALGFAAGFRATLFFFTLFVLFVLFARGALLFALGVTTTRFAGFFAGFAFAVPFFETGFGATLFFFRLVAIEAQV
ncbi:hypothetical protein LZC95_02900 [Pendulispora brunnea]|uniref:Uncharacterized protein n=1 Tax=Pendulispora brunnea TaxID=2905690 RepID=A0ABZ2KAT7_9BACT